MSDSAAPAGSGPRCARPRCRGRGVFGESDMPSDSAVQQRVGSRVHVRAYHSTDGGRVLKEGPAPPSGSHASPTSSPALSLSRQSHWSASVQRVRVALRSDFGAVYAPRLQRRGSAYHFAYLFAFLIHLRLHPHPSCTACP